MVAALRLGVKSMWTLILMTLVFSGSVTGGVAVNTSFLDFPNRLLPEDWQGILSMLFS
jgi:hypothetical protein